MSDKPIPPKTLARCPACDRGQVHILWVHNDDSLVLMCRQCSRVQDVSEQQREFFVESCIPRRTFEEIEAEVRAYCG